MKKLYSLIALLVLAIPATAAEAPQPNEPAAGTQQQAAPQQASPQQTEEQVSTDAAATAEAPPPASTGSLRETVTERLRTFTPSEVIDVDKPVDFPANI